MAISFTNIWKDKVIDILKKFIRTEFKGAISVYAAEQYQPQGNCSIRIFGLNQSLARYDKEAFSNEYTLEIVYYLLASNLSMFIISPSALTTSSLDSSKTAFFFLGICSFFAKPSITVSLMFFLIIS